MSMQEQMIGEARAYEMLERAVNESGADQTEIVLEAAQQAVTRYANNEIHQNVAATNTRIAVRAIVGKSSARAFANHLSEGALREAVVAATEAARRQAANPKLIDLPSPRQSAVPLVQTLFAATADQTPLARAQDIRTIIDAVQAAGFVAFGTAIAGLTELAVVNSHGVRSYAAATEAYLRVLADNGQGTGYADVLARDVSTFDPRTLAAEAITKCRLNINQIALPPGDYAAVLEANCVADFVRFPVIYGMGALAIEQGSSFMAGNFGTAVTSDLVTLWDDPHDPACLPMPIDYEGMPAQRIDLIDHGIARDVANDAATAGRRGTTTNGHAGSPWEESYPLPEHIVMAGGTATADELTRDMQRGVRITRLHYTHSPDPKRVIATGTTRDDTFLVENGEIVAAVKNLRFTQSVLDMLATTEALGQTKPCRDWWASNGMGTTTYVLPAIRVGRCTFTGVTTF